MEIAVGGDDFPAQLAAEYGYVNRVLPEDELDDFVDTFARRVAGAIPAGDYAAALAAFKRTAGRPENADHVRSLFERGLQQPDGIELDVGKHVAEKL
ncbi:hypothetical protein ABZY05_45365 [Streptomyces canus]|uniref:hypothetical protein n=1 Tax=Streptomyces canus TaxID=58343 RepID=UPI0033AB4F04